MKFDFVRFSSPAITPTKGAKIQLALFFTLWKMLLYLRILQKLLGLNSVSKFLEDTLEKVTQGLA